MQGLQDGGQYVVQDVEARIQVCIGDGQWRGDAEDPAHAWQLHDVHVQPAIQAGGRDLGPEGVGRRLARLVGDQFHALQQAAARSTSPSLLTTVSTVRATAAARGSDTCVVKNRNPRSWQTLSISSLVTTAATGSPAPRVFDSVSRSGMMPSCSNAYISPVRPIPVCASSTISSMPRSTQSSLSLRR